MTLYEKFQYIDYEHMTQSELTFVMDLPTSIQGYPFVSGDRAVLAWKICYGVTADIVQLSSVGTAAPLTK